MVICNDIIVSRDNGIHMLMADICNRNRIVDFTFIQRSVF